MNLKDCLKSKLILPAICGGSATPANANQIDFLDVAGLDMSRLAATADGLGTEFVGREIDAIITNIADELYTAFNNKIRSHGFTNQSETARISIMAQAMRGGAVNPIGTAGVLRGVRFRSTGTNAVRGFRSIVITNLNLWLVNSQNFDITYKDSFGNTVTTTYAGTAGANPLPDLTLTNGMTYIDVLIDASVPTINTTAIHCGSCGSDPNFSRCAKMGVLDGINPLPLEIKNVPSYGFTANTYCDCDFAAVFCNLIQGQGANDLIKKMLNYEAINRQIRSTTVSIYNTYNAESAAAMLNLTLSEKNAAFASFYETLRTNLQNLNDGYCITCTNTVNSYGRLGSSM